MNQNLSPRAIFYIGLVLVALVWTLAYALPRYRETAALERRAESLRLERQGITQALEDYARSKSLKGAPAPNTAAWVTSKALQGLEKNIDSNSPYKNGQGVQLKLRALSADQITTLLNSMRQVNLILRSFKLDDLDGNGKWNLELMVEVPA